MSLYAIRQYYTEVEKLIHYGGTTNEMSVRNAFSRLLDYYAQGRDLKLVMEVQFKTESGKLIRPDGTLKDSLRLDHGYWESKDGKDDIEEEIRKKLNKGYPFENILFDDTSTAVLFQNNSEVLRVPMTDGEELDKLLNLFVSFERREVKEFHKAIEYFKEDIPKVTSAIQQVIADQKNNLEYNETLQTFFQICRQSINPSITIKDVQEMLVQHILTADIFNTIFDEPHFHQENNIAREINKVIDSFFIGSTRRSALSSIKHYYDTINAKAATIADHHEKQFFLKAIYENFYKAYNPKAADKLGIVYTPNEIVKFMIESTDFLLQKHFNKTLADRNVDILDPATGTGTFICDIIDYLKYSGANKLEYKYKHEMHANEVAILPYYIANLNIEYTYRQAIGRYAEFENLCFVDTLDNTEFGQYGKQIDLFNMTTENTARIRKQNKKKISVIIGNPPYNANQLNERENNKNREYPTIDRRIKETYIKKSTAQKTKVYDMYARFYRWATDRIQDDGIVCLITNNSFINARTFDGFRKCIQDEFQYAYFIDLGGNVRDISGKDGIFIGEKNTIFGEAAAVGIAIGFLVKQKQKGEKCLINYVHPCDIRATRDEKISYLQSHKFEHIEFEHIDPDKNNNWINLVDNDWDDLFAVANKSVKQGKSKDAIFELFSLGIVTSRDEWVYDFDRLKLSEKVSFFIKEYQKDLKNVVSLNKPNFGDKIKYSRDLKKNLLRGQNINFKEAKIINTLYRPFVSKYLYYDKNLNEMQYQMPSIYGEGEMSNFVIILNNATNRKPFTCVGASQIFNYNFNGDPMECLPFYRYENGERIENITDWGKERFEQHYKIGINKLDIFYYVYAVLHNPTYLKKYELNLKREFPRIPCYENFHKWVKWGKSLFELHNNFNLVEPYRLKQMNVASKVSPKTKLKAQKACGIIQIDENTEIHGVPKKAWDYKLGLRSALEWILDQYKEKKSNDDVIAKLFDNYHFQERKEEVIATIGRICAISVKTVEIIDEMSKHLKTINVSD